MERFGSLSGFAKAETPFGNLAGRTRVRVFDQGADSIVIEFNCGGTPVVLSMAGANYHALVREILSRAAQPKRDEYEATFEEAVA